MKWCPWAFFKTAFLHLSRNSRVTWKKVVGEYGMCKNVKTNTLKYCSVIMATEAEPGFAGSVSGKEPACQCRRHKRLGFSPRARKIPWRMRWQPTAVFLPGESHGQRSLAGYSPWSSQRVGHDWSHFSYTHTQHTQAEPKPPNETCVLICHTDTCRLRA